MPHTYSLDNPVFSTYVAAAALVVLKLVFHSWLTVQRMIKSNGGMLNPEDLNKTISNPNPHPDQLQINEYVDRSRRMHRNELENSPAFLAAGLISVATDPPLWLASTLLYGYVVARLLHFYAYATAKSHETRATFFTLGSFATIIMAVYALWAVII